ncbi:MAG: LysM peptidoglycan-binding domain-containing protein, partial [Anaerolineales bacterium]|nr:LysM peptidoglycan-binding domain-containing protein [Anaerolineales bacterium]
MKNAIHWLAISLFLTACATAPQTVPHTPEAASPEQFPTPAAVFTPLPTRPPYAPGELVEYTAQTGDTLPALAARFNTTEAEIRAANPVIPQYATTMRGGFPMKIPIYYKALWGTPYQILPDSLFVNGPAQVGFDVAAFVNAQPGW